MYRQQREIGPPAGSGLKFAAKLRLLEDAVNSPNQYVCSERPFITFCSGVWWYWSMGIVFMEDDNKVLYATFIVKSIGASFDFGSFPPDEMLNEPTTQQTPIPNEVTLSIGTVTYSLTVQPGGAEHTYVALNFLSKEALLSLFKNNEIDFKVVVTIAPSYFKDPPITYRPQEEKPLVFNDNGRIVKDRSVPNTTFFVTLGDSREYFLFYKKFCEVSDKLKKLLDTRINTPETECVDVSFNKSRLTFPTLQTADAGSFVAYMFVGEMACPPTDSYMRISKVVDMLFNDEIKVEFYSIWQSMILRKIKFDTPVWKAQTTLMRLCIGLSYIRPGVMTHVKRVILSMIALTAFASGTTVEEVRSSILKNPDKYPNPDFDSIMKSVNKIYYQMEQVKEVHVMNFAGCQRFQFELGNVKWTPQ